MTLLLSLVATTAACEPLALEDTRREMVSLYVAGDFSTMLATAKKADDGWKCASSPAQAGDLVAVYQLAGYAAFKRGDEAMARQWFLRSLAVSPSSPLDSALAVETEAAQLYKAEQSRLAGEAPGILRLDVAATVDGATARDGARKVAPGTHLVQVPDEDGWPGQLLRVAPGAEVSFPPPENRWLLGGTVLGATGVAALGYGAGARFYLFQNKEKCVGRYTDDERWARQCGDGYPSWAFLLDSSLAALIGGGALTVAGTGLVISARVGGATFGGSF